MSIQINFVKTRGICTLLLCIMLKMKLSKGIFNKLFYGILHRNSGRVTFFVIIVHRERVGSLQQMRIFHESMREAGQDNSLDLWPLWSSHNLRVQQPHYRIIRYDWHNAHFISCLLSPFLRRYFIARYPRIVYIAQNRSLGNEQAEGHSFSSYFCIFYLYVFSILHNFFNLLKKKNICTWTCILLCIFNLQFTDSLYKNVYWYRNLCRFLQQRLDKNIKSIIKKITRK